MSTYRPGSNGDEVERIQARLSELGLYRGPLDGAVGPLTWRALFSRAIPSPAIAAKPLKVFEHIAWSVSSWRVHVDDPQQRMHVLK